MIDINGEIMKMYATGKYSYREISRLLNVPKSRVETQVNILINNINKYDNIFCKMGSNFLTEEMMIGRSDDYTIIKRYNTPVIFPVDDMDFKTRLKYEIQSERFISEE